MNLFVKNSNSSLRFCLSVLKFVGFLAPEPDGNNKTFLMSYRIFWFMFIVGFIIIAQAGEMFQIWGDVPLMTSASFLLFTNLALASKIINVVTRRQKVQGIIDEADEELVAEDREEGVEVVKNCNRETSACLCVYIGLSAMTVFGWACSAEKNQLPLRAWYPYDKSKSPAYELTYADQSTALVISALVNVCLDTLVTSLVAVCRCRLRLVRLSLRTLCDGIPINEKVVVVQSCSLAFSQDQDFGQHLLQQLVPSVEEKTARSRLRACVVRHESALTAAAQIQDCFNEPILAQFTVSTVIICVTAYQLAMELSKRNWIRIVSMIAYLFCMMLQVFLYCYQGNQLTEESSEIASAAYMCPWYACSVHFRRALLIVMVRSRRVAELSAGGFTTLSLGSFMSIIKVSYTFFTVLRQV